MQLNIVVDTCFFSSLMIVDDVNHKKAVKIYTGLSPEARLIAPRTVQIEILHLAAKLKQIRGIDKLLKMLNVRWIDIDESYMEDYQEYVKNDIPKLKPMDSTVLFAGIKYGVEVLTFDGKLKRVFKSYQVS